jgi:hypothetical protein
VAGRGGKEGHEIKEASFQTSPTERAGCNDQKESGFWCASCFSSPPGASTLFRHEVTLNDKHFLCITLILHISFWELLVARGATIRGPHVADVRERVKKR